MKKYTTPCPLVTLQEGLGSLGSLALPLPLPLPLLLPFAKKRPGTGDGAEDEDEPIGHPSLSFPW
jgi:hypothetical protein